MAQNNDPLFQSPKQFLKSSATEQPIRDASFDSGMEGEEPVLRTRPSYAEIASVQGVSPNAMRKAPSIGDFSDEKLLEMMKAPLTGEEVAAKIADLNANGVDIDANTISKDEFIAYDEWRRKQHFNFWGAVGDGAVQATKEIAGGVLSAATDWKKLGLAATVGVIGTPVAGLAVAFGASAVEGFARGTRDLGGLAVMAANHPDSPLYRMFVNPTDDKDVAYEDFLDLSRWNSQSEKILAGKTNAFMPDRQTYEKLFGKQFGDTIDDFVGVNKELATAASYVLDPTTFMTFGGGAAAKTVAAKAGAAALKSGQAGNAVGHAVAATASRNAAKATFLNSFGEMMIKTSNTLTKPVDAMFDTITGGMERLTGVRHNVSPVTGEVKAQRVHAGHGGKRSPRSLTHALMGVGGVYSAFSIPYALPITSVYAGLKGLKYLGEGISDLATKGAKNADSVVGNAIRASSPIGIYMTDLAKTTIHGGIYGGVIGYATAGEEGAAGGIGTGVAIGAIGHNVGYAYGTLSGKFAKEALYKEFDEHMVNLKDKGDLLKQERVMKFINDIKEQHGPDEALRAISHVMGLEKSKNVTVSYMNYDDMVKALENDPNMTYWEETEVDVAVPAMEIKPDTLKPVDPNAPVQAQAPNPPTKQKKRTQKLTPMGEVLYQAVAAKAAGGQGWNGMFTTQNPITGKIETKPYALWKNGETGQYHVIINIDNVQAVRDAAGNIVQRFGPEKDRTRHIVPEGDETVNIEDTSDAPDFIAREALTPEDRKSDKERTRQLERKVLMQLGDAVNTKGITDNAAYREKLKNEGFSDTQIDNAFKLVEERVSNRKKKDEPRKKAYLEELEKINKKREELNKRQEALDAIADKTTDDFKNKQEKLNQEVKDNEERFKNAESNRRKITEYGQNAKFDLLIDEAIKFLENVSPSERKENFEADLENRFRKYIDDGVDVRGIIEAKMKEEGLMSSDGGFETKTKEMSIEEKNLQDDSLRAMKDYGEALDEFVKDEFSTGLPEDIRSGGFGRLSDSLQAKAVEAFEKTEKGSKLSKAQEIAFKAQTEAAERARVKGQKRITSSKLKMESGLGWSRPATVPMQGPMQPKSVTTMVQIVKTAPLGELWHVMNQVYREVNHQQTITNEVRNWLLTRAFTNRADTVKFMLETYDRIGGRARDIGMEGGRWMKAINEFEQTGKIENPEVADSFNRFCEELGEAIFLGWEDGKPFDYIFRGGDLGFARGLLNDIADSFYNRALRDATNLGADIRTKDAFVDWFKKSRNSGVRIDPILADTFKDLVRFYNDKNMKNAGLNRTDLVRFSPAQIKDHARIYGYENRLQYGPNGEVTGLKPMLQYNQETHMAGKAMIQELAELATVDEAALNGLDFYIYNDKDDVDLAMNGTDGTLDTVGKSGQGFLFQSPDYKGMGVGLDDIVNAQIAKAKRDGIYAPRDATSFGKRGRARTTPTGKMGEMMKEALAKGQHVVFRGIPTEKAFKIIEKYVPKAVADNVRLLAPIIADGGFSRPNVINGKYLGFTQAQRDGTILSREWGDEFSPRDVTFVPYDMQFKITLKDLKNPNEDYKRPHFRFNVRSVDIDALNRRGTILWNQSPELQKLYNGLHEFKADIFKTMDEYSGSGMIPATDFFGANDNARLKRKHVVAAIGASPNTKAQLMFSAAETEWHPYQKRDRGAEQNNPWFWMHMDGLHGLHTVDGEVMRMRMNEKGYYRAMVPTPTHEGAVGPNGVMMNQMYQSPDALTPSQAFATIADEKASLEKEIQGLDEKIARQDKFGRRGNNPSYSWLNDRRRVAKNRLNEINRAQGGTMFQNPDEVRSVDRENEITQLRAKLLKISEVMAGVRGMQRYSPEATRMLQLKREFQAKLDFLEGKEGVIDETGSRQMFQSPDKLADFNYDAMYGKGMGPLGKRDYLSTKKNMTPTLAGTRYDMLSEEWVAGFVGRVATQNNGGWRYVGKNGDVKEGNVRGHTTEFKIRRLSEGKGKYRLDVGVDFYDMKGKFYGSIGGELSQDRKTLKNVSVMAIGEYQGKGYGNMMYSEMLERMRALGVENFDGEIINSEGRPAGVRDNMFGAGNTYIMGRDWDTELRVATDAEIVRRLQGKIDLGDYNGVRVRSRIRPSAFYQSPDAPIRLDIESMRRFNDETSDKPYDVNRVAEGLDDPLALLKKLNKLNIFKKSKLREDYSYAETYGAKNDQDASFLASNFKWAAQKGDVFQSDALRRFVQQTTGSKDIPVIRHTLEEFVSSTNAGVDAYNQSFKTGVPVAFVATQGTISPKLGDGDFRRDIKALKAHNHFNGQQATSYAYSYGGPQFANDANAFPEGNQIRAAVGMKNPLVYDFKGEYMRDDIVSTLVDKAKREKRDGIVMLNAIDPRVSSNVKDNHYIIPKGNESQIAVIDDSFGKSPMPRGLGGAEGGKMFQNPDDGVTLPKGIFGPNNPETVKIARTIMMKKGVPHSGGQFIVRLNPEKSFKIGMEYDRMKHDPFNPLVRKAYEAMARETLEQYQAIIDAGYTAEMHYEQEEPYANSRDAIQDIRDNKRLRVLATDLNFGARTVADADIKENPLLAMSPYKDANGRQMRINDVFRFVHDFFGHSERGNGFGPIGEENAWDVHARMYSPLARRAMTSGTRGQNSWVNFVNEANIEINRKRDLVRRLEAEGKIVEAAEIRKSIGQTRFADQKIGLMPEWTSKTDAELTPIETELYGVHQTVSGGFGLYQQPDGYEVNIHSPTVEQFSAIGKASQAANKFGTSVEIKAPHDYEGYELLMAGDGLAQAAISPDGELGSVVRGPNGKAADVDAVIRAAIATGKVKWLNGFDTVLPSLYNGYGFEAVARLAFVDEYRPDGWDYNLYGKFNKGRPDVVFMALVGDGAVPYEKNGKHIPMVASYDDAVRVTKERNRQAQEGGTMFQNNDISILSVDEKPLYELNELRLKYAEYIRFVDGQIKSGAEGFTSANRILKLRQWLADNGPKNEKNQPQYNPLSIGERVRVGNTMVDIKDFDKSHRDVVLEGLLDKARERVEKSAGVKKGTTLTPEQIELAKKKAQVKRLLEGMVETARERFRSMSEEQKEEMVELVKKAKRRGSRKKKEATTGDLAEDIRIANEDESAAESIEANIENETQELIDDGVDPAEAKRIAIENAKKNAQKIEYAHDTVVEGEDPVDTIRYYATVASREEVAKMLKKEDSNKDLFTDEDYLDMADGFIKEQQTILRDIEIGNKRPMPKDTTKFGGKGPDIDARPPTIKLVDLYKKYKGSEWFSEDGKPLQWRKKDGTIVKSDTKPSGAEAVEPPEIIEMKAQIEKSIKEIKAMDYNTRGISALVGLMYLWGYRLNPNLLDKGFDPAFVDMEKMVSLYQNMTPEHALRAELATSGSLVHMFEEGAEFKTIVASIPDLVDTTSDVLSLIMRTTEFSAGTFGNEKNASGATVEAKELMSSKFVEKYYIMLKNNKGNTYGATLGDIFYRDAQDYAEDKIRDKKKNFEKTHGRPPSVFEVKGMMEELEDYYTQRKGRVLINQFFAPEGPIDPKTGKVKSGWQDKSTSIEKNIKNRLRETSNAAKKAKDWANVLTEEQIRSEAKSMVFNLQREFIEFMFEEANSTYEEQIARQEEASKRKQMTALQRQEARRKANASGAVYPQTGAMGWDAKLEQNRENIKKLEDANTPKEERDAIISQMNIPPEETTRSSADVASEATSIADMQAEVKKVEEAHRKAQAEAREKQGLPPVMPLEAKPTEPVTPQISQAVPPPPQTSNATAKPTSRAEHEQREKMRKVMAEMTGEPFEPIPYEGPETNVPVVEAKDAPNVGAYEDVDITEPTGEDAPPPPPKKKKVTVNTQATVDKAKKDQADANTVKPPEQVAVSVATVEQVGPIGARSVQHQQAVKDVLAIQDNLTLETAGDGNRKSVATKDKRYVVWKGVGNNNKALYVWMAAHEDIYRGTPLEKRRIAVVSSYEEAQLAIREFDNLMRVLAEREGLNTSQIVQASAPVMTPVQATQTAQAVAKQVKQNPPPPPATPTRKAHLHPDFSGAIIGLKMVIKMSNADAKKMVETAIDKLGDKATLEDIVKQVLLDRQALAATVARANEQFAASVNAGAAANPDAVANVTITPSQIGLRNSTGAPRLPAGPLSSPLAEIVQPFNFNPSQGEIAAYKMLTTFRTHTVKYPVGNGGQAEGVMYVNPANYSIVQSGPSKWRLFNPAKALMSVWDNEQEACDAIFKHYFKR